MNSNEVSRHLPFDPISVPLEPDQINQIEPEEKEYSFFRKHRVKLISAVAAAAILAVSYAIYDKMYWIHTSDGVCPAPDPNDKFNLYDCHDGELIPWRHDYWTPLSKRAKACSLGEEMAGCINGEYFHYLSNECQKNPGGVYCNRKKAFKDPFES